MRCTASHSVVCNAPEQRVYELVSRTTDWPQILEPCEAVTVLEADARGQRVEIVARLNGVRMAWESRRTLRPDVNGIDAEIVRPMPLVADMRTFWRVIGLNDEQCLLLLEHDYRLCDDVAGLVEGVTTKADAERFIAESIDTNSMRELRDFKAAAERRDPVGRDDGLRHTAICAASADEVYALVREPGTWPRLFDACVATTTIESDGDTELVRIDAIRGGEVVSWETRRRYLDAIRRVDYELPVPMPFLESMSGEWRVIPLGPKRCVLTVDRRWRLLADVTGISTAVCSVDDAARMVREFVDGNAESELLAIRAFVEQGTEAFTSVTFSFSLPHRPDDVFAALAPNVGLGAGDEVQQSALMSPGASVRNDDQRTLTVSFLCPVPSDGLRQRYGRWQVRAAGNGSEVRVRQSVFLDVDRLTAKLGTGEVRAHKRYARELLEKESTAAVEACVRALAEFSTGDAVPTPDVAVSPLVIPPSGLLPDGDVVTKEAAGV